jgi:GAF domain-containing protein/HAMP domain-containing protein
MRFTRIHRNFLLPFLVLVLIFAGITIFLIVRIITDGMEKNINNLVGAHLDQASESINTQGEFLANYSQIMADNPRIYNNIHNPAVLRKEALDFFTNARFDLVDIVDTRRIEIISLHTTKAQFPDGGNNHPAEPEERYMVDLGLSGINTYGVMRRGNTFMLVAVAPTKNNKDINGAVLLGKILDQEYLLKLREVIRTDVGIYGRGGEVVASTYQEEKSHCIECHSEGWFIKDIPQDVHTVFTSEGRSIFVSPLMGGYKFGYMSLEIQGEKVVMLAVKQSALELIDARKRVYGLAVLVFIFSIIAIFTITGTLAQRIIGPIDFLAAATKKVAAGDLEQKVDIKTADELEDLAHSFNAMTQELKKSREAIDAWEKEMEQKLAERTEELNISNALLQRRIKEVEEINLRNASLVREIGNKNVELQTAIIKLSSLNEVGKAIASVLDLEELLVLILSTSANLLGAELGFIMLEDPDSKDLVVQASWGLTQEQGMGMRIPRGTGIAGWVVEHGEPLLVANMEQDSRFERFSQLGYERKTLICLPLKVKNKIIGAINVTNKEGGGVFTSEDLQILEALAGQAVVAIENARLFQEERKAREEAIQMTRELGALIKGTTAISSHLDLDELLKEIVQLASLLMNLPRWNIMLLDDDNQLVWRTTVGIPEEWKKIGKQKVGESLSGWVALNQKPLHVYEMAEDSRFVFPEMARKYGFRSYLGVPMIVKGKLVGVLNTYTSELHQFIPKEIDLLQAFANQAAVAIENAQLYTNLQKGYFETIRALVNAIEAKDKYTRGHSERVTHYGVAIAKTMEWDSTKLEMMSFAGALHDIGKIGIDLNILNKKGRLTPEEYKMVQQHPLIGVRIMEPIGFLKEIKASIIQHHEHVDGSGYPHGIDSDNMSMEAKILGVADAYDAMTTERPYQRAFSPREAVEELRRCAGTQFDSQVVESFVKVLAGWNLI